MAERAYRQTYGYRFLIAECLSMNMLVEQMCDVAIERTDSSYEAYPLACMNCIASCAYGREYLKRMEMQGIGNGANINEPKAKTAKSKASA